MRRRRRWVRRRCRRKRPIKREAAVVTGVKRVLSAICLRRAVGAAPGLGRWETVVGRTRMSDSICSAAPGVAGFAGVVAAELFVLRGATGQGRDASGGGALCDGVLAMSALCGSAFLNAAPLALRRKQVRGVFAVALRFAVIVPVMESQSNTRE